MAKTVISFIGTSYSGSSILSLLLDAHSRIRALGEVIHLSHEINVALCCKCNRPAEECLLSQHMNKELFYTSIFDFYNDCDFLVDSSKSVQWTYLSHPQEPSIQHQFLILSKSPREFAYSWIHHHPEDTVGSAFSRYFRFYRQQFEILDKVRRNAQVELTTLKYAEMMSDPQKNINQLLRKIGVESFDLNSSEWWTSDSHIIGGNWLVAAQASEWEATLGSAPKYYRDKYQSRLHKIFYDDSWESCDEFQSECDRIEKTLEDRDYKVLSRLGR